MENMKQPKIDDQNRKTFYSTVYPMVNENADTLLDISSEINRIIFIDCCGWYYNKVFNKDEIMLETFFVVKNYQLSQNQFTKLIDDRNDKIVWPSLPAILDPVVILDRSPILKYRTVPELKSILLDIVHYYNPVKLIIRGHLQFIDDSRLQDRIQSWSDLFNVSKYVTVKFYYDTDSMRYELTIKRCQ